MKPHQSLKSDRAGVLRITQEGRSKPESTGTKQAILPNFIGKYVWFYSNFINIWQIIIFSPWILISVSLDCLKKNLKTMQVNKKSVVILMTSLDRFVPDVRVSNGSIS